MPRRPMKASYVLAFAALLEIAGFLLASRGVVRESFVELSRETGGFDLWQPEGWHPQGWLRGSFDPEAFDPDSFSGSPSAFDKFIVNTGLAIGLLPSERELSAEHRRDNARSAVIGVVLVLVGMLLDALVKARRLLSWFGACTLRLAAIVATRLHRARQRVANLLGRTLH